VVVLDELMRADFTAAERGVERIWRAASAGGAPGGPLTAEVAATVRGVHGRPWAPAHLVAEITAAGGRRLSWTPRSRLEGDRWDGPDSAADPMRFRVRWLDGDLEVGAVEVEAAGIDASGVLLAELFSGGIGGARAAVSQWGDLWGWGLEATTPLA
jgi:hypothetical protein